MLIIKESCSDNYYKNTLVEEDQVEEGDVPSN